MSADIPADVREYVRGVVDNVCEKYAVPVTMDSETICKCNVRRLQTVVCDEWCMTHAFGEASVCIYVEGSEYITIGYKRPLGFVVEFHAPKGVGRPDPRIDLAIPFGGNVWFNIAQRRQWRLFVEKCVARAVVYRKSKFAAPKVQRAWRRWYYTRKCYDPSRPANKKRMRAEMEADSM